MQHSYIHSSGRRLSKLTLTLLLLVTIVGVCSASPLPEKAREDRSGYSDLLSEEYVEKAGKTRTVTQPPSFTHFLTEAFCLSLQPSRCSEKPKNRRPMNFMLGYTWIDGKSTTRVKPNAICRPNYYPLSSPTESYYDSSVVSETSSVYHQNMNMLDAVERLGALSDILRSLARPDRRSKGDYVPVKYRYYFPSPNYFRAFVPTGSKQASFEYRILCSSA
ncbi:hypothetical protein EV361DRAFT_253408 [Lentinula raphanica]|nr:hypothetical protein EV361DRAFT_253408 [Lentinula raphanica]